MELRSGRGPERNAELGDSGFRGSGALQFAQVRQSGNDLISHGYSSSMILMKSRCISNFFFIYLFIFCLVSEPSTAQQYHRVFFFFLMDRPSLAVQIGQCETKSGYSIMNDQIIEVDLGVSRRWGRDDRATSFCSSCEVGTWKRIRGWMC